MPSMNYGGEASFGSWSWDPSDQTYNPPYTQSHQHQSKMVLATIHGELKNLVSLIEQELHSHQEDATPYHHLDPISLHALADEAAFVSNSLIPLTQSQTISQRRGPSVAPPAMQSIGDSATDSKTAGIGPSASPRATPSYGDSDGLFRDRAGLVRFPKRGETAQLIEHADSIVPSAHQATTYGREQTVSSVYTNTGEQDKDDLPPVPEEHGDGLVHAASYAAENDQCPDDGDGIATMDVDQLISSSPSMSFVNSTQKNHLREMFSYLTGDNQGFLTIEECLRYLRLNAPELLWERDMVVRVLDKLDSLAGTTGRVYESGHGGVVCDFKAFCFLIGNFDPKTFDDEDITHEMREYMMQLRRAFQKHARQIEEEEKIKRLTHVAKGPLQGKIALAFDTVPAFVIMINAVVIGVSADVEPGSAFWEALELFFLFFFTSEFCLKARFAGLRNLMTGPDRWWNYFDLFCIVTAFIDQFFVYFERVSQGGGFDIGDVIPISLVKMLKLVRLARLVRLLRFKIFHELKMMVQGVVSGVKVLIWAIVLLFFCIFCLGIVMRKMVGEDQAEFSTLPAAMFTLFRCFTDGCSAYDGTPLAERLRLSLGESGFGLLWMVFYILVILFVTIGIFNLIMAIFIDNVVTAQMQRKQQQLGETADAMEIRINEVIGARFEERFSVIMDDKGTQHIRESTGMHRFTKDQDQAPWWKRLCRRLLGMADPNKYTEEGKKKMMAQRRSKATSLLCDLGVEDEERVVTRDVFSEWLREPEILGLLEEVEVETSTKWELFDALDVDGGGELTVDELVSGLMRLRGPVSKNDIVATRLKLTYVTELVEDICRKLGIKLSRDPSFFEKGKSTVQFSNFNTDG